MKDPKFTVSVTRMVWLPVRCCCTPNKIFGFLQLSEDDAKRAEVEINRHRIQIRAMHENSMLCRDGDGPDVMEGTVERAVYSDDRPREFWRRLPGFIEAEGFDSPSKRRLTATGDV